MIPIVSLPSVAPVPMASVVTAGSSNIAVGSLPITFVAPTVTSSELNNNSRGNGQARYNNQANVQVPLYTPATSAPATSGSAPTLGFSSLFMATALASEVSSPMMDSFESAFSSPKLYTTTGVTFNTVQFMPSNAALPQPKAPVKDLVSGAAQPTPRFQMEPVRQQQFVQQQAVQQVQQTVQQPSQVITQAVASVSAPAAMQAAIPAPARIEQPAPVRSRPVQESLVKSVGAEAYQASMARNAANLTPSFEPRVQITF